MEMLRAPAPSSTSARRAPITSRPVVVRASARSPSPSRRRPPPPPPPLAVSVRAQDVLDPSQAFTLYGSVSGVPAPWSSFQSQWRCDQLDVDASADVPPADTLTLRLSPNVLAPGTTYRIALTVTVNGVVGNGTFALVVPSAPTGGRLSVSCNDVRPVALASTFTLTSWGWTTTTTSALFYSFTYRDASGGAEYALATVSSAVAGAQVRLPAGDPARNDTLVVLVRAGIVGTRIVSAAVPVVVQVHAPPASLTVAAIANLSATVTNPGEVVTLVQTGALLLLSAASDDVDVDAARHDLVALLTKANAAANGTVPPDQVAQALSSLATGRALSANTSRSVVDLGLDLVQAEGLSQGGLAHLAQAASASATAAPSSAHALVDRIGAAQLDAQIACQRPSSIATAAFTTQVWVVDDGRRRRPCPTGPVTLPQLSTMRLLPPGAGPMASIGLQRTNWSSSTGGVGGGNDPRLISPVVTVNAFVVNEPGAAPVPHTVANLSEPILVDMALLVGDNATAALGACEPAVVRRPVCVTFDVARGNWTTAGCATVGGANGTVTCACTHLTDFALMLYMERRPPTSPCTAYHDVVLDDATVHRRFIVAYAAFLLIAMELARRTRRFVVKVHARRAVYACLGMATSICAVRFAASCVIVSGAPPAPIWAYALWGVVPVVVQFHLLTFFIIFIWSFGDRIRRMSTAPASALLAGFHYPYFIGNALLVLAVPTLLVAGIAIPARAVTLFDAASLLVAGVCLVCSVSFLIVARQLFAILSEAAASMRDTHPDQARAYLSVGRFVTGVCTAFCIVLMMQCALWTFSVVFPGQYLAGYLVYYSAFLACDLLNIALVFLFCSNTVSKAKASVSQQTSSASAKHFRLGMWKPGRQPDRGLQMPVHATSPSLATSSTDVFGDRTRMANGTSLNEDILESVWQLAVRMMMMTIAAADLHQTMGSRPESVEDGHLASQFATTLSRAERRHPASYASNQGRPAPSQPDRP